MVHPRSTSVSKETTLEVDPTDRTTQSEAMWIKTELCREVMSTGKAGYGPPQNPGNRA